jgi:hypothetical protein
LTKGYAAGKLWKVDRRCFSTLLNNGNTQVKQKAISGELATPEI